MGNRYKVDLPFGQKISKKNYEEFRKQWIIDSLKGLRYGQSFCDFFKISNATPLYYFKDNRFAEKWIESHWIKS